MITPAIALHFEVEIEKTRDYAARLEDEAKKIMEQARRARYHADMLEEAIKGDNRIA